MLVCLLLLSLYCPSLYFKTSKGCKTYSTFCHLLLVMKSYFRINLESTLPRCVIVIVVPQKFMVFSDDIKICFVSRPKMYTPNKVSIISKSNIRSAHYVCKISLRIIEIKTMPHLHILIGLVADNLH